MTRKCTGALHREHMLNVIKRVHGRTGRGMRVNARYCYPIHHPIIKQLLKRGLIKTQRFCDSSRTSYTHVVPIDESCLPGWDYLRCPECNAVIKAHHHHAWDCSLRVNWPSTHRSIGWQPKNRRYVGGNRG